MAISKSKPNASPAVKKEVKKKKPQSAPPVKLPPPLTVIKPAPVKSTIQNEKPKQQIILDALKPPVKPKPTAEPVKPKVVPKASTKKKPIVHSGTKKTVEKIK